MNPFELVTAELNAVLDALEGEGAIEAGIDRARVIVEPPRDRAHGDMATNAALVLAKPMRRKPMELAELVATRLRAWEQTVDVAVAPPGFINLSLDGALWRGEVTEALAKGADYGSCDLGRGSRVNVEFCSANPTGPLHVGHGRGTVFGDALASLLARAGYDVVREYYINDGGAQIETLARSVHWRYRELFGDVSGAVPEGYYPGDYLVPVARRLKDVAGERWRDAEEAQWLDPISRFAVDEMMVIVKKGLSDLGVSHDIFFSERSLIESGKIDATLEGLEARGLLYIGTLPPPKGKPVDDWEPSEQLLFKASAFGDEIDRPLKRSGGAWTYFAADVAYHDDKIRRGFDDLIDVWGADHGGYVKRMQAAVRAVSDGRASLDVKLCQLVNLIDDGKPLKMSKRAGRIVTLEDVVAEVGKDAFRFIMLTRKNDAPLDFDLALVTEQSKDNPVFYVQYAHARICSVLRAAAEAGLESDPARLSSVDLACLEDPAEMDLIRQIGLYPRAFRAAAEAHEPHRIAFYLHDLAGLLHALWTRGKEDPGLRFLREDDPLVTHARLAMISAAKTVIANGMAIIGATPVEELH